MPIPSPARSNSNLATKAVQLPDGSLCRGIYGAGYASYDDGDYDGKRKNTRHFRVTILSDRYYDLGEKVDRRKG